MKKKIYTLLLFIALTSSQMYGQNYFDYQHSFAFGTYLIKTGEYKLAADEFERIVFFDTANHVNKSTLLRCYRKSEQLKKGQERALACYPQPSLMPSDVGTEYCKLLLEMRNFAASDVLLATNKNIPADDKKLLSLFVFINSGQFAKATSYMQANPTSDNRMQTLYGMLQRHDREKFKNPAWAGTLSTIAPGLGKVYTGYWKDGLISFLFVGISAWQAYRGFDAHGAKSIYGWIFTFTGGGFYIGNVYGTVKSAYKYNNNIHNSYIHEAETYFNAIN